MIPSSARRKSLPPTPADLDTGARAAALAAKWQGTETEPFLAAMIRDEFAGRIALVSSFGAEAAVLLHMVARIDAATPVVFLDTQKLFGETLRYRNTLATLLGLIDLRTVQPEATRIDAFDPDGILWYVNPDMCCHLRKVEPLRQALEPFDASINGRKGSHGGERSTLPRVEPGDDGQLKINPLADWTRERIEAYFATHALPRHPLEADGFLSIGCMPCTDRVRPGEDIRAGRWRDREKTECGIHLPKGKWRMDGID